MGTHAGIYVLDDDNQCILSVYRHYDGYPEGNGQDLYNILANRGKFNVNDVDRENHWKYNSNQIDDLAALILWHLKDDNRWGNIYLNAPPVIPEDATERDIQKIVADHSAIYGGSEYAYILKQRNNPNAKENGKPNNEFEITIMQSGYKPPSSEEETGENSERRERFRMGVLFKGTPEEMARTFNLKDDNVIASEKNYEADKQAKADRIAKEKESEDDSPTP